MPFSADWMTSSGAAEMTKNSKPYPSMPVGEAFGEQVDVRLQPDATAHLHEVLAPHAAVLGIVQQEIRQLATLLHQVEARQTGDLIDEARRPEQFAQDNTRIIEAQRLIEIAREQELFSHTHLHRSGPGRAPLAPGLPLRGPSSRTPYRRRGHRTTSLF